MNRCVELGQTMLYLASQGGHIEDVQRLLTQDGVAVNQADDDGHTPLHSASAGGHVQVAQALLAHEAVASMRELCSRVVLFALTD